MTNLHACLVHESPECVADLIANLRFLDPESLILIYDGSQGHELLDARVGAGVDGLILHPDPKPMQWGRLHEFALDALRLALRIPEFTTLTVVDSDQLGTRSGYSDFLSNHVGDGIGCLVSADGGYQPPLTRSAVARTAWEERLLWQPLLDRVSHGDELFPQWTFWPGSVITREAAIDILRLAALPEVAEIMRKTRLWATEEILLPTLAALGGFRVATNPCSSDYVRYRVRYSLRDVQRALERPDLFWLHPVPRNYHDPVRRYVRDRHAGYAGVAPPQRPTVSSSAEPSAGTTLLLTLPLLDRLATIPGVLTRDEADLLLAAARRALSVQPAPHGVVVGDGACRRARVVLDAAIQTDDPDAIVSDLDDRTESRPGPRSANLAVLGEAATFADAVDVFLRAQDRLVDGATIVWRGAAALQVVDLLSRWGIVTRLGTVGALVVVALESPLVAPALGTVLDQSGAVEGWLTRDEATAMATAVASVAPLAGVVVEVGSYCGRGTIVLAHVARATGRRVIAVDPFDGVVGERGALHHGEPTLERFQSALAQADVTGTVDVVQGVSSAADWSAQPVAVLVIDGLHDYSSVAQDFRAFAEHVVLGGIVAFHDYADYFPGVQALVRELMAAPDWHHLGTVGTLALLRRSQVGKASITVQPALTVLQKADAVPLVSCIMPTYNRPHFARLAVDYFLRQDYPRKELVIIDDGDPIESLLPDDGRIRYLHRAHRSSIGAKRNLACELATGDYIAHWDDDDWYATDRLSREMARLLSDGVDVVGASKLLYWGPTSASAWWYRYPSQAQAWVHDPTLCYRKSLWSAQPFPDTNHGLDCAWLWGGPRKRIQALDGPPLYVGIIHSTNTSPKLTGDARWSVASTDELVDVVGADADKYGFEA